ncbi:hypothetical protein N9N14_02055 [Candidatus Poseidonia alphae]|nr:hypothetical protein [Candidatus Poseidonia alphae]
MVAIYVLRLQRGKYYVGLTRKNVERIWQHIDGKGAAWTKKYPPKEGKEIVSFQDGLKVADEDRITLEMMSKYGVRNVRGGSWCRVNMSARQVSELERLTKSKSKPQKTVKPKKSNIKKTTTKKTTKRKPAKGYCIWCGDRKDFDFSKPMCLDCYRDIVEDPYDEMEHYGEIGCCHKCGKDWDTSIERPLCINCWRKS